MVEANGELSYMAEALRVKGNVILSTLQPALGDAEMCFVRSLEWSRRQGARAWELLTARSIWLHCGRCGQPDQARALLRPLLDQFAEGSDTAGLRAAERLLAGLGRKAHDSA